jgi:hypothetical protein
MTDARRGLEEVKSELHTEVVGGQSVWSDRGNLEARSGGGHRTRPGESGGGPLQGSNSRPRHGRAPVR